jgi:hypothetical protein
MRKWRFILWYLRFCLNRRLQGAVTAASRSTFNPRPFR